ncbi:peroxiredoxin family protein [Candidatus Harpocratesius sp.]
MAKSKYQKNAKKNLNRNKSRQKRPVYYDENIKTKKTPAIAIFMLFLIAIAGGVAIFGSLLNNSSSNVDQAEVNPNYTQNTQNSIIDNSDTSGYKTPITITTISGEKLVLSNYAGKVVVLYFHFLQCSACKYHSPALQAATSALGSDKVIVIAISVSAADTSELLNEWATSNGYNFKLAKDTDYSLSSYFGAQYTPHTVYFGPDGDSSTRHTGVQSEADITATIESLLS